jgi:hypothetical protein
MRALHWPSLAATLLCLIGCLGDPVGPRGILLVRPLSPLDSVLVGAPGRALPTPVAFEAVDGEGRPVPGGTVSWTVAGTNGRVDQASSVTNSAGQFSAVWVLGTRASDQQQLTIEVAEGRHNATVTVKAVAKPSEVSSVAFTAHDTTAVKLGVATRLAFQATDPFGNTFVPAHPRFVSLDTTLCTVDSLGTVQAHKRGFSRVVVLAGAVADTTWVHPTQIVQVINASPDTLRFHSLGQTAALTVRLLDDQGLAVNDSVPVASVGVDTVAHVQTGTTYAVRSISNGITPVTLRAGVVAQTVQVVVSQSVASVKVALSRSTFNVLSDTAQLTVAVSDSLGVPLTNQVLAYYSSDTSVAIVGPAGLVTTRGNGSSWIFARASNGIRDSIGILVAQQVAQVVAKRDSIVLDALHAVQPIQAAAIDRLGSPVAGVSLTYASGSPSIATVDQSGNVQAISNGSTIATATFGTDTVKVPVRVAQRAVRVLLSSDTIHFVALGETQTVQGIAVDSLGYAVSSAVAGLRVTDTTVLQQVDSITVRSHANGVAAGSFSVSGIPVQLPIVVNQVATRVTASITFPQPILTLAQGTPVPLTCAAYDRNGWALPSPPAVTSLAGTVTPGPCGQASVRASGIDSLRVQSGTVATTVPVTVAVAPIASSTLGDFVIVDSFPSDGNQPWAASARMNPQGQFEAYFALYKPDSTGQPRADMHRMVSADGVHFTYAGRVLSHDPDICSPQGSGLENMIILPRQEAPGWRMLYSAGSNLCWGWQVFSAISSDGVTWTKEPGVRLGNGGTGPGWPPWPVGEGFTEYQDPSGQWHLIVGTEDHLQPPIDQWQVGEWRSTDQVNWSYAGVVLSTAQMPPEGAGHVYSPTIQQIAPGLWRMVFTGDNRPTPGHRSKLWSAVSSDRIRWQIEGVLMGSDNSNLYYSSLVNGRLIYLRRDDGGSVQLATATITMP